MKYQTGQEPVVIILIIIISAVHASVPCTLILGHSHPLTATNFLDVVSPSLLGSSCSNYEITVTPLVCYHLACDLSITAAVYLAH